MTDTKQERKIKCPYCGWVSTLPVDVIEDKSIASVAKGLFGGGGQRSPARPAGDPLDAANALIDMTCPSCGNAYRYNVRTQEVTK